MNRQRFDRDPYGFMSAYNRGIEKDGFAYPTIQGAEILRSGSVSESVGKVIACLLEELTVIKLNLDELILFLGLSESGDMAVLRTEVTKLRYWGEFDEANKKFGEYLTDLAQLLGVESEADFSSREYLGRLLLDAKIFRDAGIDGGYKEMMTSARDFFDKCDDLGFGDGDMDMLKRKLSDLKCVGIW